MTSRRQGRNVLDLTGEDVSAFCDEHRSTRSSSYLDRWRTSLNRGLTQTVAE
jgi:DNA-binding ferritin-like protein (Dps family)